MGIGWFENFKDTLLRIWKKSRYIDNPRTQPEYIFSSINEVNDELNFHRSHKCNSNYSFFKNLFTKFLSNNFFNRGNIKQASSLHIKRKRKFPKYRRLAHHLRGYLPKGHVMELELMDKKIRRLVIKLKKHNVDLEVFEAEDIEIQKQVLGRGGEGVVQKCTVFYNGLPVDAAVKTLISNDDDSINITLDEIELLCLAKDPIIQTTQRVYGVAAVPDSKFPNLGQLVILTEAGLMNALQLYQDYEIPLYVTYELWSNISAAIHIMHSKKIIHQDIKPENVLVTAIVRDPVGQVTHLDVKIIDLGMGRRVFTEKIQTDDILGTNGYHPPEVLMEETYDFRADIFMLGLTFCVMLLPTNFLRKKLSGLLKELHEAKKKGHVGKYLYERFLEKHMDENLNITPIIKAMLCNMIDKQEKRTMSLIEIVEKCREECARCKEEHNLRPPILTPVLKPVGQEDSGFGSGKDQVPVSGPLPRTPGKIIMNKRLSRSARSGKDAFKPTISRTSLRSSFNHSFHDSFSFDNSPESSPNLSEKSEKRNPPKTNCRKRKISVMDSSPDVKPPKHPRVRRKLH